VGEILFRIESREARTEMGFVLVLADKLIFNNKVRLYSLKFISKPIRPYLQNYHS